MENPPLPNVQLKNSALSFVLENTLLKSIVDKIKLIPQFDQLKNDIEITEHVCNLVENAITNNSKSSNPIDKKQLVIKIMTSLFNLNTEAEKKIVNQQIDYLINNKMIQKIPVLTKVLKYVKNYFTSIVS